MFMAECSAICASRFAHIWNVILWTMGCWPRPVFDDEATK
jgi:hypothetical protein